MKVKVYFIELSDAQHDELNSDSRGWSSPIGEAYLRAQDGKIDDTNIHLVKPAASFDFDVNPDRLFVDLEKIWTKLQNLHAPWSEEDESITVHTMFPRSMSVGDIVVLENGTQFRADSLGFVEGKWL